MDFGFSSAFCKLQPHLLISKQMSVFFLFNQSTSESTTSFQYPDQSAQVSRGAVPAPCFFLHYTQMSVQTVTPGSLLLNVPMTALSSACCTNAQGHQLISLKWETLCSGDDLEMILDSRSVEDRNPVVIQDTHINQGNHYLSVH